MKGLKRQWRMEGLCQYCGGYISTWDDKCLDCDMIKDYHHEVELKIEWRMVS